MVEAKLGLLSAVVVASVLTWLVFRTAKLLSPPKNGCATGNRTMTFVPLSVTHRLLSVLFPPLGTLGAVRVDGPLRDLHISGVVARAAQPELVRSRNES